MEPKIKQNENFEMKKEEKNFSLETKKIEYLIENIMEKLEFALTIPSILENHFNEVTKCFTELEMNTIKMAFCKYVNENTKYWAYGDKEERVEFLSLHSSKELEKYFNEYKPLDKTLPKQDEYIISRAIQIFYEKPKMRELASNLKEKISNNAVKFTGNMDHVFRLSLEEMKTSPEEAARKEETLRKIFHHYSELLDYKNFAKESNENQFNKDVSYFDERIKELRAWEKKIDDSKVEGKRYVKEIQRETDQILLKEQKEGERRQNTILEEIEMGLMDLETLRAKHIEIEKEIRTKRYKTEQQLLSVLQLYDRDLIERQNIYDDKKAALDVEKGILKDFQAKYDEQTTVYMSLMKEKEEYEEKLRQARLVELRYKMAARKIQRCFKRYMAVSGMYKGTERKSQTRKVRKSRT